MALIGFSQMQQAAVSDPTPVNVTFDGTNDYWTRGGGLTGAADSQYMALYIKLRSTQSVHYGIVVDGFTRFTVYYEDGNLGTVIKNTSGTTICENYIGGSALDDGSDHELHLTYDGSAGNGVCYLDGTEETTWTTETTGTADFTTTEWSIGADGAGFDRFNGGITRIALWIPSNLTDFDISQASVRTDMANHAERNNLGSGSILDMFGAAANWNAGTNYGSGGNGTMTGAVT